MLKYLLFGLTLALALPAQKAAAQQSAAAATASASQKPALSESDKIQQLISSIRHMKNATFIRNGSEYNCQAAAEHLQSKWEKHAADIASAHDFIEKLATKSGMSGEAYKIRYADGKVVTTSQFLNSKLHDLEQ